MTQNHFVHRIEKRSGVDGVKDTKESNEKVFFGRLELARRKKRVQTSLKMNLIKY